MSAHSSYLGIGIHSSAMDFTSTPSLKQFNPINDFLPDPGFNHVEREGYQTADGRNLQPIKTTDVLDLGDCEIELVGQSGSGAADGEDSDANGCPVEDVLESFFGAAVVDATGEVTHAVDAGTGADIILDTDVTDLAVGGGILFQDASNGYLQAGEITAIGAANATTDQLTIDHIPTSPYDVDTSADESVNVYAAKTFALTVATKNHKPLMFDHEVYGESRNIYRGVTGGLQINFPSGDTAKLVMSGLRSTENYLNQSTASPAYSAPSGGSPIPVTDMPLWIDGTLYQAWDLSLDLGLQWSPRRSDGAPNNEWGRVCHNKVPVLTGKFRLGSLTGPSELTPTQKETWRGNTAVDIAWQCGRTPGAACYNRMSDAYIMVGAATQEDGHVVYPFTAKGFGLIPYRLHIF